MSVTVALGTEAPVASVTAPTTPPKRTCAANDTHIANSTATTIPMEIKRNALFGRRMPRAQLRQERAVPSLSMLPPRQSGNVESIPQIDGRTINAELNNCQTKRSGKFRKVVYSTPRQQSRFTGSRSAATRIKVGFFRGGHFSIPF